MRCLRQNKAVILSVLMHYLVVGLIVGLFHNHEEDLRFHDNCPACQWEVQSQNPDTALWDVNHLLEMQTAVYTQLISSCNTRIQSQTLSKDHASRAPPVSS